MDPCPAHTHTCTQVHSIGWHTLPGTHGLDIKRVYVECMGAPIPQLRSNAAAPAACWGDSTGRTGLQTRAAERWFVDEPTHWRTCDPLSAYQTGSQQPKESSVHRTSHNRTRSSTVRHTRCPASCTVVQHIKDRVGVCVPQCRPIFSPTGLTSRMAMCWSEDA